MCPANKTTALTNLAPADTEADRLVERESFGPSLPIAPAHLTDPPLQVPDAGIDAINGEGNTTLFYASVPAPMEQGSITDGSDEDPTFDHSAINSRDGIAQDQTTAPKFANQVHGDPASLRADWNRDRLADSVDSIFALRQVSKPAQTGEQGENEPKKQQVSKLARTGEQTAKIIRLALLTSERHGKQKRRAKSKKTGRIKDLLTSEQRSGEQAAEWLHYMLPKAESGWWEVRPEGRGFTMKFRWRAGKIQTQPFPRVSRRQYQLLKESEHERAIERITEHIAGHLEDLLFDTTRRDKAHLVAARLGLGIGNYQNAVSAD